MTQRRMMQEMLRELRAEIGMAPDPNLQPGVNDTHRALLQRNQRMLYSNEDWPHLFTSFTVSVAMNASQASLPDGVDPGGVNEIYVSDATTSARACKLQYGWDESEIVAADPTESGWPIQFWRLQPTNDPSEKSFQRTMTFWPRPDRDCTLVIWGRRALDPFVDDDDYSTIDSDLIVLQTAAEILNEQGNPNGQVKAAAAQQRKRDLLARARGDVGGNFSMLPGLHPRYRG